MATRTPRNWPAVFARGHVRYSVDLFSAERGARGDEGMWLFNYPPTKVLDAKYGFQPDATWLTHLQQAAVRFNNGGSGSFVSSDGLVMTNHHVAADAVQKLSTKNKDLLRSGFYARTPAEEIKCLDLELNVLMSIEDVTARVNAAVRSAAGLADAEKLRRAVMNTIEKESFDKTGLRSDVVTLYHGGLYQLYRYQKYTDVRLVFAPEQAIAFFGGDPDNFEYPRYDLDISFFRVYENGKPVKPPHYLKWSKHGPRRPRPGLRCRTSRAKRTAWTRFLTLSFSATAYFPDARRAATARSAAALLQPAERRERPTRQGRSVRLSELRARRGSACWPDCKTRPSWTASRPRKRRSAAPSPRSPRWQRTAKTPSLRSTARSRRGPRSRTTTTCSSAAWPSIATCFPSRGCWCG